MKEITGGCWLGALGAWILLGFIPGMLLFTIGTVCALGELVKEKKAEIEAEQAENQYKNYPSYKY